MFSTINAFTKSLVIQLGLQSTLSEFKVPKEDFYSISSQAIGSDTDPILPLVVKLLEGIY